MYKENLVGAHWLEVGSYSHYYWDYPVFEENKEVHLARAE